MSKTKIKKLTPDQELELLIKDLELASFDTF